MLEAYKAGGVGNFSRSLRCFFCGSEKNLVSAVFFCGPYPVSCWQRGAEVKKGGSWNEKGRL